MIRCAIVEQKEVKPKRISRAHDGEIDVRFSFEGSIDFENALGKAIRHLYGKEGDASTGGIVNLLIIRAHGVEKTGTDLVAGNDETINFQLFREYFKHLPENLVIYLHVCWGAFPAAAAMVSGTMNKGTTGVPIVVGPMVEVSVKHSNEFLMKLRRTLSKGISLDSIRALADNYNGNQGYRDCYGVDLIIGIHQPDGAFYPSDADNQLAAPVYPKEYCELLHFRPLNGLANVHCVLKSQKTQIEYITTTAELPGLGESNINLAKFAVARYEKSVISSRYQIVEESSDRAEYPRIVLNYPKLLKP